MKFVFVYKSVKCHIFKVVTEFTFLSVVNYVALFLMAKLLPYTLAD